MENKQTAVDWLVEQYVNENYGVEVYELAKQMEKEQIKDAFVKCWKSNIPDGIECKLDAEEYYNETYNIIK
jgi:hypothetical protein